MSNHYITANVVTVNISLQIRIKCCHYPKEKHQVLLYIHCVKVSPP